MSRFGKTILLSLAAGVSIGAGVAAISPGSFFNGWLAAGLLASLSILALVWLWIWAGGGKTLAWMMVLVFVLRLGMGLVFGVTLPEIGADQEVNNNGYLFKDAYARDNEAWGISQSKIFWSDIMAFNFDNDQYGGLLVVSATVYHLLSADAHRKFLILILAAFFTTLGLPFLKQALKTRWDGRLVSIALWIYVFYPDSILMSASQMREPFLIGLGCMAFWAVTNWKQQRLLAGILFGLSILALGFISTIVAFLVFIILVVWFLLEEVAPKIPRLERFLWVAGVLGVIGFLIMMGSWLGGVARFEEFTTVYHSGWLKKVIAEVGEQWSSLIIVAYGLAQPVLPAAIAEPTIPVTRAIGVFRAVGWYALAPFLLYGMFISFFKAKQRSERRLMVWLSLITLFWLVIAAARGGGDLWDNPRYRVSLISWMALLAAWGIEYALQHKDAWLWRWLLVETIFLGFITHWYFSRYYVLWKRLPFWQNVVWITVLSGLVLGSGVLWDCGKKLWHKRKA